MGQQMKTLALALLLFSTAMPARAGDIVAESLHANASTAPNYRGQSFTTGPAAQYAGLTFNFYQWGLPGLPAFAPATQTYFLLNREFLGRNDQLNTSTPGFIATTTGVRGDQWVFDPSVTLLGNTQYWLYGSGDFRVPISGTFAVGSGYSGGQIYAAGVGDGNRFSADPRFDMAFTIHSNPAPLSLRVLALTGDTLTLTIENIPSGQTFHLRNSADLTNFEPLTPPIDITDATPQPMAITVDPATHPALFFSVYAGASPDP